MDSGQVQKQDPPSDALEVYDTYWYFAAERQKIFFNRLDRSNSSWTSDPILQTYKFTNAYRVADRVSQFLISNVIYRDDLPDTADDIFYRIILFKLFNKIETWEFLETELGPLTLEEHSYAKIDAALTSLKKNGSAIYSGAYIMHPGTSAFRKLYKHQNHLKLIELMISDNLPKKISDTKRMKDGFKLLKSYPTIGDFLAYQFITDINYSEITNYSESEFVVAGPGALDGISKCFTCEKQMSSSDTIHWMMDNQEAEFERLGLNFRSLGGRRLQLIDCQNLFCEVSKYSRASHPHVDGVSGRKKIKQKFRPTPAPINYQFPPKWNVRLE